MLTRSKARAKRRREGQRHAVNAVLPLLPLVFGCLSFRDTARARAFSSALTLRTRIHANPDDIVGLEHDLRKAVLSSVLWLGVSCAGREAQRVLDLASSLPNLVSLYVTVGGPFPERNALCLACPAKLSSVVLRGAGVEYTSVFVQCTRPLIARLQVPWLVKEDLDWISCCSNLRQLAVWQIGHRVLCQVLLQCLGLRDLSLSEVFGDGEFPESKLAELFLPTGSPWLAVPLLRSCRSSLEQVLVTGVAPTCDVLDALAACPRLVKLTWWVRPAPSGWPDDFTGAFTGLRQLGLERLTLSDEQFLRAFGSCLDMVNLYCSDCLNLTPKCLGPFAKLQEPDKALSSVVASISI